MSTEKILVRAKGLTNQIKRPWRIDDTSHHRVSVHCRFLFNRIRFWNDLKPEHLEAYAKCHFARGCSRKTVLHYLEPVRIAYRWAGKNEPSCRNRISLDFRLPPKHLRNTLPTEAEKGGWMSIWVRPYLAEVESDWKKDEEMDTFVQKLRENVVIHIDAEVKKCKEMQSANLENVVSL